MNRPLRIALPSKGRLAEPSYRLFRDAGIPVEPDGRRLRLALADQGVEILLVRADDIPVLADDRAIDAGVCGANQIEETGADLRVLLPLGFGRCRLAVAVAADSPVRGVADLDALRVATSYPVSVAKRLAEQGVTAHLIPISGSVELAPSLGAAEAVADLVSTGETLRVNGLREVATLLDSEAVLLAPPQPDPEVAESLEALVVAVRSVLAARPKRYVMLNVHDDRLAAVLEALPAIDAPTVLPLARDGMHAVHAVVDASDVIRLLTPLKQAGASGILVLPIEHLIP